MRVLGLDPGFATFGFAEAYAMRDQLLFTKLGAFFTVKDDDASAATDLFERCRDITSNLLALNVPDLLCVEAMSYPRNASSATKLGASHGVIAAVVESCFECGVTMLSPYQARKVLTGLKKPTEQDAHEHLLALYPEVADITKDYRKKVIPHALDAAVQVAAWWKTEGHGLA